jgi:hypothetical protein
MSASRHPLIHQAVSPGRHTGLPLPCKKRPASRPYLEVDRKQLLRLARLGLTVAEAAPLLRMGRRTLFQRLEDAELRTLWEFGRAQAIEQATRKLQDAIASRDLRASMFLLKRKGGWGTRPAPASTPASSVD